MAAFVEAGITTFDCADIYTGVEELIGGFGGWSLFQELLGTFHRIAGQHGRSIARVALRWVLERPNVAAAIVGATSARHLAENVEVFDFVLDEDDHAAVAATTARRSGPAGDCFGLERDREGRHGRIMRYDLNEPGT